MKKFNTYSVFTGLFLSAILSLMLPLVALAATTPSLGDAASYVVLASTYTNTSAGTTVVGDVGFTTGPAIAPGGAHTNYGSAAPYATAGVDQGSALSSLNSESCTFTFAAGAINLSTDTTHGAIGVYTPGVYCSTGAMDVAGPLTLSGSGTYIFRPVGALTSTAGAIVTLNGASACDVFWTPSAATTLAANTTFMGTVIDAAGVTVGANTTWTGRVLAFGGTVTTDTDTITAPSCSAPVVTPEEGTIRIIKVVINDDGGTKVVSDFPLFVDGTSVTSGAVNTFDADSYTVTETEDSNYTQTFSGDCDSDGDITLDDGDVLTCTITNNDIAEVVDEVVPEEEVVAEVDVEDVVDEVVPEEEVADVDVEDVAVDIAAPVDAAVPGLPATGTDPKKDTLAWSGLVGCIFAVSLLLYVIQKKRTV